MQNNIVLCGFMGCGKTTVGKLLAQNLGYTFVDTDAFIEQKENMSVSDIFAKKGEPYFRKVEAEAAKTLGSEQGLIIATGGGMMLSGENAANLNKTGLSFWVKISVETVLERLKNDTTRPLLQKGNKRQAVAELMQEREPLYAANCRFHISGEGTPEDVASRILNTLK